MGRHTQLVTFLSLGFKLALFKNVTFSRQSGRHISQRLGLGWTRGFFSLKDMSPKFGTGGVVFLYATGQILNTTADFKNIAKTQYLLDLFWEWQSHREALFLEFWARLYFLLVPR